MDLTPKSIPGPDPSLLERVRAIWAVAEVVIEEAILAAEALSKPGADKKAYVADRVTEYLKDAEEKHDVLPGIIEGVAFHAIEFALDWMIERVFARLSAAGQV